MKLLTILPLILINILATNNIYSQSYQCTLKENSFSNSELFTAALSEVKPTVLIDELNHTLQVSLENQTIVNLNYRHHESIDRNELRQYVKKIISENPERFQETISNTDQTSLDEHIDNSLFGILLSDLFVATAPGMDGHFIFSKDSKKFFTDFGQLGIYTFLECITLNTLLEFDCTEI